MLLVSLDQEGAHENVDGSLESLFAAQTLQVELVGGGQGSDGHQAHVDVPFLVLHADELLQLKELLVVLLQLQVELLILIGVYLTLELLCLRINVDVLDIRMQLRQPLSQLALA